MTFLHRFILLLAFGMMAPIGIAATEISTTPKSLREALNNYLWTWTSAQSSSLVNFFHSGIVYTVEGNMQRWQVVDDLTVEVISNNASSRKLRFDKDFTRYIELGAATSPIAGLRDKPSSEFGKLSEAAKAARANVDPNAKKPTSPKAAPQVDPYANKTPVPPKVDPRCTAPTRLAAIAAVGGNPEAEHAAARALEYLKAHQNPDGSWGTKEKVGTTGLALLAFLGRCETPESTAYGDAIIKAIMFLVEMGKKNGAGVLADSPTSFDQAMEHGIASCALGELYLRARLGTKSLPGLRETWEKAVSLSIRRQQSSGGWPDTEGGGSFMVDDPKKSGCFGSAWQVLALNKAKRSGIKFPQLSESLEKANQFFLNYPGSMPAARAISIKAAQKASGRDIEKNVGFAQKELQRFMKWESLHPIEWLFYTQCVMGSRSPQSEEWNRTGIAIVLQNQQPDGGWVQNSPFGDDKLTTTAFATLILEGFYGNAR